MMYVVKVQGFVHKNMIENVFKSQKHIFVIITKRRILEKSKHTECQKISVYLPYYHLKMLKL